MRLSVSLMLLFAWVLPAEAQVSNQERAQAYYFEAEAAFADGNLERADDLRLKARSLLGADNAKLLFLDTRIHFAKGEYAIAKRAVADFYAHDPGPNLIRDIAPYVVRIDEKLEEARLAEIAAAEAEAAAEQRRRERPARIARTVSDCVDAVSCAVSYASLEEEEDQTGLPELLDGIREKQCDMFDVASACLTLAADQEQPIQTRLSYLEKVCEQGDPRACNTAGEAYLGDEDNRPRVVGIYPEPQKAMKFLSKACFAGDLYGCAVMSVLYWKNDHGVPKDKEAYRKYMRLGCQIANKQNLPYYNTLMKEECEDWGFPRRAVGKDLKRHRASFPVDVYSR